MFTSQGPLRTPGHHLTPACPRNSAREHMLLSLSVRFLARILPWILLRSLPPGTVLPTPAGASRPDGSQGPPSSTWRICPEEDAAGPLGPDP